MASNKPGEWQPGEWQPGEWQPGEWQPGEWQPGEWRLTLSSFPGYPSGAAKRIVSPEGRGTSGVLALGEAPGQHEDAEGLPFRPHAEAGSLLERALYRAGVPRDSLTLANIVWYQPPKNWLDGAPWERGAINICRPLLDDLVARVKPRCILALGGVAFRELTGMSGHKQGIKTCRGFQVAGLQYPGIPVVGTYHPSGLRRASKSRDKSSVQTKVVAAGGGTEGMALLGVLIRDIQLAAKIARDGPREFAPQEYILGATLDQWRDGLAWLGAHPEALISYDLETRDSVERDDESEVECRVVEITQAQISWRPGQAIVSPWTPDLAPLLRAILELPNPKLDWNGRKFDRPILRDIGVDTSHGVWHDGMDLWHHAQPDLPRGLQYAASFACPEVGPWKHLSASDPLWYGALDVDMPQRIWASLRTSLGLTCEIHSGVSLWDGYVRQVAALAPVLDRMSARGMPVDETQRQALNAAFAATEARLSDKLQTLVPEDIRNVEPKEGYRHKTRGLPVEGLEVAGQANLFGEVVGAGAGPNGSSAGDPIKPRTGMRNRVVSNGDTYVVREFRDAKSGVLVPRWARLLPFLPGSSDQVKRYIQARGWGLPRNVKTDAETTDELGLRKLIHAHLSDAVLPLVLEHREVAKARGTYVKGWRPGPDGRVHSTFGFKPATGQLSSENPNLQNMAKHAEIAQALRRMIQARPGHRLVSFDWKSFHVLTTGFEAQCRDYMRLARLDMHSFFALVGLLALESPEKVLELPDSELKAKLKWYRKQPKVYPAYACQAHPGGMTFAEIRDEKAKRTILGVGFGQSGLGMYKRNSESFANQRDARICLDMLNRVFPRPEAWRRAVRLEADAHQRLITRFGYQRWFWGVFSRRPVGGNHEFRPGQQLYEGANGQRWALAPGDDHEACVAYRPANDAFGIKREVMVELGERGLDERFGLVNEIHDDLLFECSDSRFDECVETIKSRMERPCLTLTDPVVAPQGLWCEVEVKSGRNWQDMEEIHT